MNGVKCYVGGTYFQNKKINKVSSIFDIMTKPCKYTTSLCININITEAVSWQKNICSFAKSTNCSLSEINERTQIIKSM